MCPYLKRPHKLTIHRLTATLPQPTMAHIVRVRKCRVCFSRNSKLCSGCRNAVYCSETCMLKDLPTHEFFCSQPLDVLIKFSDVKRPSSNHIRAALFEVDHQPCFIWLESNPSDEAYKFRSAEIREHLKMGPMRRWGAGTLNTIRC